ncbi:hypothetical protein B0H13DRAFT_1902426 [Mycena leptocephala]|nr:hypothetical protein B0H13DRAFT_1902426 [Mycena leptocephala]
MIALWWTEPIPRWERERAMTSAEMSRRVAQSAARAHRAWEYGARNGDDMWMHVEDFIARKRRAEIDAITQLKLGLATVPVFTSVTGTVNGWPSRRALGRQDLRDRNGTENSRPSRA